MYAKDLYEARHQFLINKRESIRLNHFNDSNAFIEYLNYMQDVYKYVEEYNIGQKPKILIVFDMIPNMINNKKKLNLVVAELFIREN